MFGTSTHSYYNEQMLGMVGQVVHEDYHIEFLRIRDHLVEIPLRAELDEHQGVSSATTSPVQLELSHI
jgi:hypothetical protein